jgi:serine phosphatase RsbU (regulator of sigma subunit)/anti-sigma regulatory factor (Ser/Thr protein kinase)
MTQGSPPDNREPRSPLKPRLLPLLWIIVPSVWCSLLGTSIGAFISSEGQAYFFLFVILLLVFSAVIGIGAWLFSSRSRLYKAWHIFSYIFSAIAIIAAIGFFAARAYIWLLLALLLISIGFALARSKRFEGTLFVNRALVYSILSICLALIYFGGVAALQLLTEPNSKPEVGIVISTLIAVAMFYPLRTRIQKGIDKRFYRSRYDAEQVIAAFNATLREEIDLDQLCDHLKTVVEQTMQPMSFSLWLYKSDQSEIALTDPLITHALHTPGALDLAHLQLDSPLLQKFKEAGISLIVPLVAQKELVGLLNLGPRLGGQKYSQIDRSLLERLATNVAPALRLSQMVREQEAQVREHERIEQELRTARRIQHALLPKEVPTLPGWQIAPHYQPAWEVGGDFYDFLLLHDGRLGFMIGDVAGKGVPAALLMATTRSMLRIAAQRTDSPGEVLAQVNDLLLSDMPPHLFVTCFYALLDPATGRLCYANAGHDLPYRRTSNGVEELDATGTPLGLLPAMHYEEHEVVLNPGESILFYSDGLVEAHNQQHEMFGFPRLAALVGQSAESSALISFLLNELVTFTGGEWEQEDDITLVVLHRTEEEVKQVEKDDWQMQAEWTIPSEAGKERQAMEQVAEVVQSLPFSPERLANLKTAVAEATMNAIEHGNHYNPDKVVTLQVLTGTTAVAIRVGDQGEQETADGETLIPETLVPDLEAKLAGLETPRGWGLFLIKNLVDELHIENNAHSHTVEMIMHYDLARSEEQGLK